MVIFDYTTLNNITHSTSQSHAVFFEFSTEHESLDDVHFYRSRGGEKKIHKNENTYASLRYLCTCVRYTNRGSLRRSTSQVTNNNESV